MKPYLVLAATIVLAAPVAAPITPGFAQAPAVPPKKPAKPAPRPAPTLDLLRHDPETQGVLLFIARSDDLNRLMALRPVAPKKADVATDVAKDADTPDKADAPTSPALPPVAPPAPPPIVPTRTPAQFAQDIKRRVTVSGNASAIVPLTMAVIAKNPPPADPYSDMAFDERFMMMLGKFSRAQWAQAASPDGIGLGDMTPEQREIYAGLWGEKGAKVNTYRTLTRNFGRGVPGQEGPPPVQPDSTPLVRFDLATRAMGAHLSRRLDG